MLDQDLVRTTLGLVAFTYTYDELGGASNLVGKAFCTAGGYISFELGATAIVGTSRRYYVRIRYFRHHQWGSHLYRNPSTRLF